jgi:hypothetical protein
LFTYAIADRPVSTKYLSLFPKPLLDDLVNGRWLPVIGAGMSLNAVLQAPAKMPLWSDLSRQFAEELGDYSPTGVLDAISAYEHEFGRARLIERLADLLHLDKAQPGAAHKEFCSLPFDIVCTTNFDFLLEKQYDRERQDSRAVHPVVDEDQLSVNIGNAGTLLLKLHGDIRHPKRLVVTEADYDGFLTNYPLIATYLSNQLITKTAVFVGYSLDDPDFRQIWHVVSNRLGKTRRMAYAILVNARPGDIARFERMLFLLSESETFSVSTNTPDAMLLQRGHSEGAGSIEPNQREGLAVQRAATANTARFRRFHRRRIPTADPSVVRLRM